MGSKFYVKVAFCQGYYCKIFISNIYEIIFLNREKENTQSKVEKLNAANAHAELEALKNQIDPHFIFNCLNSIQHFVVAGDVKNANKYLTGFAQLMRQTLEHSKAGTVTVRRRLPSSENSTSVTGPLGAFAGAAAAGLCLPQPKNNPAVAKVDAATKPRRVSGAENGEVRFMERSWRCSSSADT